MGKNKRLVSIWIFKLLTWKKKKKVYGHAHLSTKNTQDVFIRACIYSFNQYLFSPSHLVFFPTPREDILMQATSLPSYIAPWQSSKATPASLNQKTSGNHKEPQ